MAETLPRRHMGLFATRILGFAIGLAVVATPVRADPVQAAQLALSDRQGTSHRLDELIASAPAILHFWATWCAPCRKELPDVAAFRDALRAQGLADRLIVISVDSKPRDQVEAFVRDDLGLAGFETYQADSRLAGARFRLKGYPATVLLDAAGVEVERVNGPLVWADETVGRKLTAHLSE